jgi:hypothetical protein
VGLELARGLAWRVTVSSSSLAEAKPGCYTNAVQNTTGSGHFHAVRFYESPNALSTIVADFLGEGLAAGLPAVVIATAEHWDLVSARLLSRGFDLERLQASDDLIVLDAQQALAAFMIDGMPDPRLFRQTVIPVMERACRNRPDCVIRAYGEMVDVLWQEGRTVAAVKLEMLWNELARTHDFALLCGYAMGHFYKSASVDDVCSHHTHVVSASGDMAVRQ